MCTDVNGEGAQQSAAVLEADGIRALAGRVDVSSPAEVDALVQATVDSLGRLDVMANVAGIISQSTVLDTTDEVLDRVLAVNLKGVFHGCRAAARVMVAQGSGSIVNMASAAIDAPSSGLACYGMAKAAVVQLTRVLAMEVGGSGVRVNAVAPGFVETAMTSRHFTKEDGTIDEERRQAMLGGVARMAPLHTVGRPEDVAHAVLYLASGRVALRHGTDPAPERRGGHAVVREGALSSAISDARTVVARRMPWWAASTTTRRRSAHVRPR